MQVSIRDPNYFFFTQIWVFSCDSGLIGLMVTVTWSPENYPQFISLWTKLVINWCTPEGTRLDLDQFLILLAVSCCSRLQGKSPRDFENSLLTWEKNVFKRKKILCCNKTKKTTCIENIWFCWTMQKNSHSFLQIEKNGWLVSEKLHRFYIHWKKC